MNNLLWSNETIESQGKTCNKLAVQQLRSCLQPLSSQNNQHCWRDSQRAYQACQFALTEQVFEGGLVDQNTLDKIDKLVKDTSAKKIRISLKAAANLDVYQSIIEKVLINLEQLMTSPQVAHQRRQKFQVRWQFYQQLYLQVDKRSTCELVAEHLKDYAGAQQSQQLAAAVYREIKPVVTIYCDLL